MLHQFLVNPSLTIDPQFAGFVLSRLTSQTGPPGHSPGLLLLLFHHSSSVRDWAYQCLNTSNSSNRLRCIKASYLDAISRILGYIRQLHGDAPHLTSANDTKFFVQSPGDFWSAFPHLIEKLPLEILKENYRREKCDRDCGWAPTRCRVPLVPGHAKFSVTHV